MTKMCPPHPLLLQKKRDAATQDDKKPQQAPLSCGLSGSGFNMKHNRWDWSEDGLSPCRGPACRIRWIWLRFGGFLVTLSSQLQLRPSQPHALPQEKYSADFEAALISKCVFPDLYFSKNLCLGMRVNFGLRVICGRFLCNYSCPPQSNIKTMTGCYWELGTVSCPRERKIEMWLSLLDAQAIPYKNHYFNLTSGSDTPHSRT